MSAESEREAAYSVQQFTADLNTAIDHAHKIGLIVELETSMLQVAGSPAVISHIQTRCLKPIIVEPA